MDLRGHGASDVPFRSYAPEKVGEDLTALVETLALRDVVIAAESFSAASAVWAAAERPDLFGALTLVGSFVRDLPISFAQRVALRLLMRRPWGPAAWGSYYRSLYPTRPLSDLADYTHKLVTNLKERGRFEAVRAVMGASKRGCEARLGDVETRTLVVMGSRDPDFPNPSSEANLVAGRMPCAEVAMIEGAGHYPPAEMPELFVDVVDTFVRASY